ncbi:MAG: ribonuclease H-like domain-containing protein [Anaerolineales bacterium]
MDLIDRLRRIAGEPGERPRRARASTPIDELVGGQWIENEHGRCLLASARFALDHRHGHTALRVALDDGPGLLALAGLDGDLERLLFLDTETTGLGRDAGTVAFLVGVGSYDEGWFTVRQYFMDDVDDELALLGELEGELARRPTLVTFNGTGFDWPLLVNRYLFNGWPPPTLAGHLDLLRWSRSLWRNVLPSCALSALEGSILGVTRSQEDVPGYLIPQLYYDYLRTGDARPLEGVFYHNLMDVLSMACLLARVARSLAVAQALEPQAPHDPLAVGRLHERLGRNEEALAAYAAAAQSAAPTLAAAAWDCHSLLLKRLGRLDEAAAVWRQHLDGPSATPVIELAKYLEHRERDYAAAREIVLRGMAAVEAGRICTPWPAELLAELAHRLERLERRLSR